MNFISRIIKSINAMRERLKIERHEAMYGPHFNIDSVLVSDSGIPLIGSTGVQLTSADVINGNRLLVYFNKCEGIFQVVNHIPTTTA